MGTIIDSYSESNYNVNFILDHLAKKGGQAFTGNGSVLVSCVFYMNKVGSPTGNIVAKIYAHSGTYGLSSVPTGSPLAISQVIDSSTLPTNKELIKFTFLGTNQIILTSGTKYIIILEFEDGTSSNYLNIAEDNSSPTHSGCHVRYTTSWTTYEGIDLCFYVYGRSMISGISKYITGKKSGVSLIGKINKLIFNGKIK
jgi:hypothetical protein